MTYRGFSISGYSNFECMRVLQLTRQSTLVLRHVLPFLIDCLHPSLQASDPGNVIRHPGTLSVLVSFAEPSARRSDCAVPNFSLPNTPYFHFPRASGNPVGAGPLPFPPLLSSPSFLPQLTVAHGHYCGSPQQRAFSTALQEYELNLP